MAEGPRFGTFLLDPDECAITLLPDAETLEITFQRYIASWTPQNSLMQNLVIDRFCIVSDVALIANGIKVGYNNTWERIIRNMTANQAPVPAAKGPVVIVVVFEPGELKVFPLEEFRNKVVEHFREDVDV